MDKFEYKLVKTPAKRTRYTGLSKSDDPFAITLMDAMNQIGSDGWQFVRQEIMTETRRKFLGRKNIEHVYMVYRRPLRANGASVDMAVAPRRVKTTQADEIERIRARVGQIMLKPSAQLIELR